MGLHVSEHERELLKQLAREAEDVRLLRRVQALLDLDSGESPQLVSRRYQVARSTIYNWIKRYRNRGLSIEAHVPEYSRPGIPTHEQRSVRQAGTRGSPEEADDVRIVLAADDQDHHSPIATMLERV